MINSVSTTAEIMGSDNIIDGEITITEKLDTFRFIFEKQDGKITFYKKDYTPINLVERTLTDMWEDAIYDITESVKDIDIPDNYMFGVSYTPVERPLRIPYPNLPKYILTDISIKGKRNKKVLSDNIVTEWAEKIGIGTPPIIFKGKLDEHQKSILVAYDKKDFMKIKDVEFSNILEKIIGKSYSAGNIIEGIVISDGKKLLQIESHEFNLLKESYNKMQSNKVLYEMVLIHMSKNLNNDYLSEELQGDMGYINIVSKVFNEFIETNTILDNISESDLTPIHYGYIGKLNKTWISNTETLEYLNESAINQSIFKIFLNALRRKKVAGGLLNDNVINNINKYISSVSEICYHLDSPKPIINEDVSDNNLVNQINKQRKNGDLDNMKVISSIQRAFKSDSVDKNKGTESVIVFVSNFSPISVSEFTIIEQLHNQNNKNIILCHYNKSKCIIGDEYVISDNLVNAQMKSLKETVPYILDFICIDNDSITEIFDKCRPLYEPNLICCTNNASSDYKNQLYFNEHVSGGKISVLDNFNIIEQPNPDQITILQMIENDNAIEFKNWTPKCVHWLWNNINNEYKIWMGEILNNKLRNDKVLL